FREVQTSVAHPFRDLIEAAGLRAVIVSDLPTPAGAFGPEDKMDAYLNRCEAVLVLATPDDQVGEAYQPRPNISDEIGRARSRETLRRRICVLKEPSVRLHSNIDAVYERLDPNDLTPAIMALLRQLTEWG
ncbi:MAG: TIR domain-containing protein, partial [Gammaproteobacteria bacterium]